MSLEAWGDEGDVGPEGYVTDEHAGEMVREAVEAAREGIIEECARMVDEYNEQSETGDTLTMLAENIRALKGSSAAPTAKRTSHPLTEHEELAEGVLKLTKAVRYMVGIAERGEGRLMLDDETAEQFVLRYVQRLEEELKARTQSATEVKAAPSPLGGFADVLFEYDGIVDRFDRDDPEADFVMRGSDWREIRGALDKAQALVDRLTVIHADDAYKSVWTINQIHVGPYTGPTYTAEFEALRDLFSRTDRGSDR